MYPKRLFARARLPSQIIEVTDKTIAAELGTL